MDAKEFRRNLRKNMTPAEVTFWQLVRNRNFNGHKFRRQVTIENYVVDFVCFEKN